MQIYIGGGKKRALEMIERVSLANVNKATKDKQQNHRNHQRQAT